MPKSNNNANLTDLVAFLTDDPVQTPQEVFRRCEALEQLSSSDTVSSDAMPAIMRSLVVPVSVDCGLALRVAAAEAAWKVGGRRDLALPFLAWALKDEYWGVSRKAAEVLAEMGPDAHDAIPDLVGFAERRLEHGPFHFEKFFDNDNSRSLLAILATAIGSCGGGIAHVDVARRMLNRMADCEDTDACAAARQSKKNLQHIPHKTNGLTEGLE